MKDNTEFQFLDTDIEKKIQLKPLEIIYHYNFGVSFGIMTKGNLLLVYEDDKGKRMPLKNSKKNGMILGGYDYFLERKVTDNFYYIAMEKTEILKISSEKSKELLTNSNFLFQYLKNTTVDSFSLIEELVYRLDKNVEKFLAYVLLNYSDDGQINIKNFSLFSDFMKCSRSNFYLALGKLIDKGIVKRSGKIITIVKENELEKIAEL
ncbi:Crp/Fnr family transcriptional regulator [Fusobacterium sp. IOR10]|uniref:Crp/Fnr family transcriptional regulator n=1 Tax=Fusobacterium sp. IOR10 TaxID=2665157 RepID=UPI0013D64BD4|nr:Crp/Fnr family transcriptional regulator [Fusobacterium sp. IOR10]